MLLMPSTPHVKASSVTAVLIIRASESQSRLFIVWLLAGQEIVVHAVGAEYTTWEGYVEEGSGRAVIGLSYEKLCRDVKPGGRILLADGSITIQV